MPCFRNIFTGLFYALILLVAACSPPYGAEPGDVFVEELISQMSLEEKIGQLQKADVENVAREATMNTKSYAY